MPVLSPQRIMIQTKRDAVEVIIIIILTLSTFFLGNHWVGSVVAGCAFTSTAPPPKKSQMMGLSHGAMGTSCLYCN